VRWFLSRIPTKVQHGLATSNLTLTRIDYLDENLLVGTNVGLVYFFSWANNELHKLRLEVRRFIAHLRFL
jgi:hypothetical protein